MTENQAIKIISLLENINSQLSDIKLEVQETSAVESNTSDIVSLLKQIKSKIK